MPITKISPKHQITIPKDAFEKLGLEVGDIILGYDPIYFRKICAHNLFEQQFSEHKNF